MSNLFPETPLKSIILWVITVQAIQQWRNETIKQFVLQQVINCVFL